MHSPPPDSPDRTSDRLVEIIETLERCGLEDGDYNLQDWVDVDALLQLLTSSKGDVSVRFTVQNVELIATPDDIRVPAEGSSNPDES